MPGSSSAACVDPVYALVCNVSSFSSVSDCVLSEMCRGWVDNAAKAAVGLMSCAVLYSGLHLGATEA